MAGFVRRIRDGSETGIYFEGDVSQGIIITEEGLPFGEFIWSAPLSFWFNFSITDLVISLDQP